MLVGLLGAAAMVFALAAPAVDDSTGELAEALKYAAVNRAQERGVAPDVDALLSVLRDADPDLARWVKLPDCANHDISCAAESVARSVASGFGGIERAAKLYLSLPMAKASGF